MSSRAGGILALTLAGLAVSSAVPSAQQPAFRATTALVSVSASVKRGNTVVANLTAADFVLTDNGVAQTVDAVSIESVPIDVTLFLDTSGSTSGKLDEMRHDVQSILQLLRPTDRFRLLTIGDTVNTPVPWVPAGTKVDPSLEVVGGISLIRDALMLGLVHKTDPGRRHLIVGMTDREDCGSVVPGSLLLDVAGRSDAVLHLVDYSGSGAGDRYRVRGCSPRARPDGEAAITRAAERTGGELHKQSRLFRGSSIARAFKTIFDDFRQSYVLRYSPHGVTASGWHAIVVRVPKVGDATIRARQGYYGE
ncbi:MAG: VWA domain-containing protein [Vicinamibacterales bacterium]